jgi:polyhydroxyalkanoate synthase
MAAKGVDRIKAATVLATIIDFTDVGEASVFVDEGQLASMEKHMADKGYLEGHHMGDMFSMMREKDLIWFFVEQNYLLGRGPRPFDLLYWNADSTRLPSAMLLWYLRHMYMNNDLMKPGAITLDGVPIDISRVTTPFYALATREDHIAPWRSTYPVTRALGGPVKFVLGGSGHIAGVINPPTQKKYGHWTNTKNPPDPDAWLEGATHHEGSWWPDWGAWLARRAGKKVPARQPGDGELKPIEDAPGSYVRVKASG